ncbi:MAG: methyltransferase domain-containing protein [Actinobacteria bacterium]|nr:methyltransferase domain-containing protein [Actinomycetota bacterium]
MTTTAEPAETFELTAEQAEGYEARFVPALFAEWAPLLVDAVGVGPGDRVLDVACGTGIVARTAAARTGDPAVVAGLDRADAMLSVARRLLPTADFRRGDAAALPFDDGAFDAVLCQAGLMFFPAPEAALAEMARVAAPDGNVGVQVWGRLESSPGYLAFVEVAARHAGADAIGLLSSYFVHGDLDRLSDRFGAAGLEVVATTTRLGAMRYDSVDDFVTTEVGATPLAGRLDEATYAAIREDSREALRPFAGDDGIAVPIEGHILVARPVH